MGNLEGMLVVDQRGDIRMCSGSLARRIGRAAAGLTGQPVWSLLPGWNPFGDARAHTLRMPAGRAGVAVQVSWETLHLAGETLFMVEVRGRDVGELSIGACVFPGGGSGSEDLRRHADRAMYRAKRAGGNTLRFHPQALVRLAPRAAPDA